LSGNFFYHVVGDYSVVTNVPEFQSLLGHCFEPLPSKTPIVVCGVEKLDGFAGQVFLYPNQIPELSAMLGIEIPASGLPPVPDEVSPEAEPVPETVTATQARLWLLRKHGLSSDDVRSAIESMPNQGEALIRWEYSPYIERSNPLVETIGLMLGLGSDQLDDAFREAATYG
jgi:hypothetical protein